MLSQNPVPPFVEHDNRHVSMRRGVGGEPIEGLVELFPTFAGTLVCALQWLMARHRDFYAKFQDRVDVTLEELDPVLTPSTVRGQIPLARDVLLRIGKFDEGG